MRNILVLSAVVMLFSIGCVSSATLDLVQQDLQDKTKENATLQSQNNALKKQAAELDDQLAASRKENESLRAQVGELSPKAERAEQLERASQTYEDLAKKLEKEIQTGQIEITEMKNRLTVTMVDKIIFPSGSTEISEEGRNVLDKVIDILKDVKDRRIQVEGHTDNVPIVSVLRKRYPTNWELSTARATEVVRYLQEAGGIDPKLLSATGYSQYQPVAPNDTEEGKRKNRRIEIVLLPLLK